MVGEPMFSQPPQATQRCPACGQLRPPVLRVCYCGHSIVQHDITAAGGRSRCLHHACGCTQWRPDEEENTTERQQK